MHEIFHNFNFRPIQTYCQNILSKHLYKHHLSPIPDSTLYNYQSSPDLASHQYEFVL